MIYADLFNYLQKLMDLYNKINRQKKRLIVNQMVGFISKSNIGKEEMAAFLFLKIN